MQHVFLHKTVASLQDLSHPDVSEYTRQSWPFYSTMHAVVGSLPLSQVLIKKGNVHRYMNLFFTVVCLNPTAF